MITISPMGGSSIEDTAKKMVDIANRMNESVSASFNGVWLTTNPGGDPERIIRGYWNFAYSYTPSPRTRYQRVERIRRFTRRLAVLLAPIFDGIDSSEAQDEDDRGNQSFSWSIGKKMVKTFTVPFLRGSITREFSVVNIVAKGNEAEAIQIQSFSEQALPVLTKEVARFSRGAHMKVSLKEVARYQRGLIFALVSR